MIMLHGDDKGLIVPPRIAPIQVVIVPIYFKEGNSESITEKARRVFDLLTKSGFAVHLDLRDQYTPGWKFHDWELKGVPLRLEVGPKDVEKHQVVLVRRDDSQKTFVADDNVVSTVTTSLEEIQTHLLDAAKGFLNASMTQAEEYDQFKKILGERGGFIRACWCGDSDCEDKIKVETGATIRAVPLAQESAFSTCVHCGKPASKVVYFARAY